MKTNGIIYALKTTKMGLSTQMKRMELISENIANVEKMPDEQGNSYQRKVLISESPGFILIGKAASNSGRYQLRTPLS